MESVSKTLRNTGLVPVSAVGPDSDYRDFRQWCNEQRIDFWNVG